MTHARSVEARRKAARNAAWFGGGILFAGAAAHLVRALGGRFRDSADLQGMIAWLGAALTFGVSAVTTGLSWQGVGALASLLMAATSFLRELRQWRDHPADRAGR